MTRLGLTAADVAERLSPHPNQTTVSRWRSGSREPEEECHRTQLRALHLVGPDELWRIELRTGWLAEHAPAPPDPKQIPLRGVV